MRKIFLPLVLLMFIAACSDSKTEAVSQENRPMSAADARKIKNGRLTGDDGLIVSGERKDSDGGAPGAIGVNIFLWRATLDTLSFMPIASADPFGGVILTDWYEDPKTPGERFKVNAVILDKTLRADGIKVSVFKQKMEKSGWRDQKVKDNLGRSMEDAILTRARELRLKQLGK